MSIDKFKKTTERITLHGLGFLQLQLPADKRLHVWHPALPKRKCFEYSNIHDHRFSFWSTVLVGSMVNRTYEAVTYAGEALTPHTLYLHEGERTRFGNRPWVADGEVYMDLTKLERVSAGGSYQMQQYVYHSTEALGSGRVATLMTKLGEGDAGAHSACLSAVQPDVDFDRKQWSEAKLWEIVSDVLLDGA